MTDRNQTKDVLGVLLVVAAIAFILVNAVAAPALAQPGAPANNTTNATGGANTTAPIGSPTTATCEDVQTNPAGEGPNYRVVRGACEITVEDGAVLSNVWFRGNGKQVHINSRGRGWTIRNVAITDTTQRGESLIDAQVNSPDGRGVIYNAYISGIRGPDANAIFVNSRHAGHITVANSTGVDIDEDYLYGSPSGNLHGVGWGKESGQGGTVAVTDTYVKNVGQGPEQGYGIRLGSDGSSITDTTIVGADVGVANLFAVGGGPSMKNGVAAGVTLRNVDIVQSGVGIRLGSHQNRYQQKIDGSTITRMEGVRIDASQTTDENLGAKIQGGYALGGASPAPPAGAPRSAERAASGVGGGSGSIGGAIGGGPPSGAAGSMAAGAIVALLFVFVLPVLILKKMLD